MTPIPEPVRLTVAVGPDDHHFGRLDAPVSVVEYGDFECPYCGEAYRVLKRIQAALGDEMVLVFRHFPLANVHPHAEIASEAVESVGHQGHFWAMHDMVFENQSDLSIPALLTYAAAVGADPRVVAQELDARTWQEKVRRDLVGGAKSGVNGTPTFFIGGFRYDGQWDYASLLRVLSLIASDS